MTSFIENVQEHIDAAFPCLLILTHEEDRCLDALKTVKGARSVWRWSSPSTGWRSIAYLGNGAVAPMAIKTESPITAITALASEQASDDSLFVLLDFHPYLGSPAVSRAIRDALPILKAKRKTLVFISPALTVPAELDKEVTPIPFDLPSRSALAMILDRAVKDASLGSSVPTVTAADAILASAAGLTEAEAESAFALALARHGAYDADAAKTVRAERATAVKRSGLVKWIEPSVGLADVGGLGALKAYITGIAPLFQRSEDAKAYGLLDEDFPRSIALIGQPGCGKSLAAEAIANVLGVGCVQTDFGRIFSSGGGKVGAAEGAIDARNALVEAMAPVVDWCDEMEKGVQGALGQSSANPWEARVAGSFLTWFESFRARVLVVGTINRHEMMPPEMLSRFQSVWFVGLPSRAERREIVAIHAVKRGLTFSADGLDAVADRTHGFNGRELRNLLQAALQVGFVAGRKVDVDLLLASASKITPLSELRKGELDAIAAWAKENNVRSASAPEAACDGGPNRVVRRKGR